MSSHRRRRRVLLALATVVTVATLAILSRVLATVFFAITVAYVLFPVRQRVVDRGYSRRVAATVATVVGFVAALSAVVPIFWALYARSGAVVDFVRELPAEIPVSAFGFETTISTSAALGLVQGVVQNLAVSVARATPVIALKLALFVLLVYALLLRPHAVRASLLEIVPPSYHDIVSTLHERVRSTLYAIYVLQAATAFGTFLIALVVFVSLGYESPVVLAVLAGLLQFIPVVGPSILVIGLGGYQVLVGQVPDAVAVLVLGLVLVAFLPDAVIRPRLASFTADMPGSLYFVGFTGGILSLGVVGFIAGPLAVALLIEVGQLFATEVSALDD